MDRSARSLVFAISLCVAAPPAAFAVDHDGDITGDGRVDVNDVLRGLRGLIGAWDFTQEELAHGDVAPLIDGVPAPDGVFNLADVAVIARLALGVMSFLPPDNQFNIGDSIGEGEAADGTIGEAHHETVWSTGYAPGDVVYAVNERLEDRVPLIYLANDATLDPLFNRAVSGSVMADFQTQALEVAGAAHETATGAAGMVTVLLGSNDVCAPSIGEMTSPALFESQYRSGLDVLASSAATRDAQIHVSGLPPIYWLWNAKRTDLWCRLFAWPFVPCQNLLANPADDCASSASREDPDSVHAGDGPNCQRRKTFHRLIRDTYNPILRDVLAEYRTSGRLPNARYIDIYDTRFDAPHVNDGDCFHPSATGHSLLAETQWCRTLWSTGDFQCAN